MRPVLAIIALALLVPQQGFAAGRAASMGVNVVVQRSAIFRITETFNQFRASNMDFSKGYLDLPGMVQIVVNSGSSTQRVLNVTVEVEPNPELVRSIQMRARSDSAANAPGAKPLPEDASTLALGYRVMLTDRARDGDFTVPVTLTVNL